MQEPDQITVVNDLASRLRSARVELGLTQEELASKAGVRQGTIGNIESGVRKNPRELLAIAKAANVRAEWLKDGEAPRHAAADQSGGDLSASPMAHQVSYLRNTLQPLTREQVMERAGELQGEFWVELWDDAISSEFSRGTLTLWDADLKPEFGDLVIIQGQDQRIHVRVYAESLATGWQGKPLNDDYDPIPGSDSVKVIAVFLSAKARRSRRH